MAIVSGSSKLAKEAEKYPSWNAVPNDLKNEIKDYCKRTYIATNSMKKAIKLAKKAALQQV